jgi:alpha-glucosidase (family GH31 glycosyl hydrolase)
MRKIWVAGDNRVKKGHVLIAGLILGVAILAPRAGATQLGKITGIAERDRQVEITTDDGAKTRIIFYRSDIFRIWVGPGGKFSDPAGGEATPIVVYKGQPIAVGLKEEKDYYRVESAECVLRIYKEPCRFGLYAKDKATMIFEETEGIAYGEKATHQTIKRNEDDYFYGCGMQNGHFNHNDRIVKIASTDDWEEGGAPNAVPFYMTLKGYGAFRNTYAEGTYIFGEPTTTAHAENRFDCYYFYGPSLKKIIDGYTLITGRPFLTPMWALEFGDADRYNDGTYECVSYADKYIDNDIPIGWFLPNDGYGLNFDRFPEVQKELEKRNIYTGMWTDAKRDFPKIVKDWGVRLFKLDIAWVGQGYKFSLDACRQCYQYIENNSDARGILWVTLGWAGSQQYTIMWTGDNSGSLDWIRWHIPTVTGSGLSAQNGATGDVEGIYGGDRITYVRDLQWKSYTPFMMIIDNWSRDKHEKKPFSYGDPYTIHTRKALKMKSRLMPYLYTYSYEANQTGLPVQRAMVLEFPEDENTWTEEGGRAKTKYQFMSGEWLLVAPVYQDTTRWSFYLPKGTWTDFENGTTYQGGKVVENYDVSDFKLPVLVREGAIIPLYPESFYENRKQQRPRDPLQVEVYPHATKATRFVLFEDDGLTYRFRDGKYNKTLFTCDAAGTAGVIRISAAGCFEGEGYEGMPAKRNYNLTVHSAKKPSGVMCKAGSGPAESLKEAADLKELAGTEAGWCFEAAKGGIVHVKVKLQDARGRFEVDLRK